MKLSYFFNSLLWCITKVRQNLFRETNVTDISYLTLEYIAFELDDLECQVYT